MMQVVKDIIELVFSIAMIINAMLFIPQAVRIFKRKSAQDISFITFVGFNLIQIAAITHGYIVKDTLLMYGTLLCLTTSGLVTYLTFLYRNRGKLYEIAPKTDKR